MRPLARIIIPSLLVIFVSGSALISQQVPNNTKQIQNSKLPPETVVVECVAERMSILPKDVRLDLSLAEQPKPGDDFDFIEIISSIEEALNIEINDDRLALMAGISEASDLTNDLTIKQRQNAINNIVTNTQDD